MNPDFSLRHPTVRFVFLFALLYLSWYFIYENYLRENTRFDESVAHSIANIAGWQLQLLGYELTEYPPTIFKTQVGISGTVGIVIGAPCDGIVLFALFTFFIIAYPGRWKNKLWFIPAGILVIHCVNSMRAAALAWLYWRNPEWLQFNHDYTFTIIVYALVFLMWYTWVRKFSAVPDKLKR